MKIENFTKVEVSEYLTVGDKVLRKIKEDDVRLQFQVKNTSGNELSDVDCQIAYYDSDHNFLGCDSDESYHPLKPNGVKSFDVFLNPPAGMGYAEIEIYANKESVWFSSYSEILCTAILVFFFVIYILQSLGVLNA